MSALARTAQEYVATEAQRLNAGLAWLDAAEYVEIPRGEVGLPGAGLPVGLRASTGSLSASLSADSFYAGFARVSRGNGVSDDAIDASASATFAVSEFSNGFDMALSGRPVLGLVAPSVARITYEPRGALDLEIRMRPHVGGEDIGTMTVFLCSNCFIDHELGGTGHDD